MKAKKETVLTLERKLKRCVVSEVEPFYALLFLKEDELALLKMLTEDYVMEIEQTEANEE